MPNPRFTLHPRALPGFNVLTPAERDAVKAALAPLARRPAAAWPKAGAVQLPDEEPLFLVRVDDSLRAIVRPGPGGQPEILDLVRHETLQWFRAETEDTATHA